MPACLPPARSLNVREVLEHDPEAYSDKEELLQPLLVMYNSLIETKDESVANGRLLDVIRQARCCTGMFPFQRPCSFLPAPVRVACQAAPGFSTWSHHPAQLHPSNTERMCWEY